MNSYMTCSERIQTFFATAEHKSRVYSLNMVYEGSVDLNDSDLNVATGSMIWFFERGGFKFGVAFEEEEFQIVYTSGFQIQIPPDEMGLILRGMSEICHVIAELNHAREVEYVAPKC